MAKRTWYSGWKMQDLQVKAAVKTEEPYEAFEYFLTKLRPIITTPYGTIVETERKDDPFMVFLYTEDGTKFAGEGSYVDMITVLDAAAQ